MGNGTNISVKRGPSYYNYDNKNAYNILSSSFQNFQTYIEINGGTQSTSGNGPVTVSNCNFSQNSNYLSSPDTAAAISAPSKIYKSSSENGVTVNWNSNPESDLSGYKIYYNPIDKFSYANSIDIGNDTSHTISGINLSDTIVVTAYDNEADGTNDLFEGHESWYSQPAQLYFTSELISGNSYCAGEEIQFEINTIADFETDNNFIIQLSDTAGIFDNPINLITVDTSTSVILRTLFPDTLIFGEQYKIRLKSTNPKAYSSSDNVIFYQIPSAKFALDTNKLCGTDTVLISYTGTAKPNATYSWDFSEGNIISGAGAGPYLVNWDNLGDKNVSLTINDNGCYSSQTTKTIEHNSIPTPTFTAPENICFDGIANINYTGTASNSANFKWNFNNGTIHWNSTFF